MPARIEVPPGTVFGHLTVIEDARLPDGRRAMLCRCGCGKTKAVAVSALMSGGRKSCGCRNREAVVPPGSVFGWLTVIEEAPASGGRRMMLCRCKCGTRKVIYLHSLRQGLTRSCGCFRRTTDFRPPNFIDLTGERFGRLVVVRYAGSRGGRSLTKGRTTVAVDWACVCDCGNEKVTTTGALRSGFTASCGCARRKPRPGYRPPNTLPAGRAARNRVLNTYRGSAYSRGLDWQLTEAEFDRIMTQDCHYCGAVPSMVAKGIGQAGDFIHGGIDRVDNTQGYFIGNVVPCCRICNHAKNNMTYGAFTAWITRLTKHRTKHRARLTAASNGTLF